MRGKRVLIGVTGGIAAYKTGELVRAARRDGAEVRVVMTEAATRFVTPLTFEALSGNPVGLEMFGPRRLSAHEHIEFARWADVFAIAPATANTIAKLASGLADNLLSTAALACTAPLVIAPAMNTRMWEHAATQANMRILRERGAVVVGPEEGGLSCGESGGGRMSEPPAILEAIKAALGTRAV